ncbi:MAG: ACP phosphodiesterase [Cytophagales bacterium]
MNFIAHLYFSGTNEGLMVGNFIADAVKGRREFEIYPPFIQQGIILHRKIDTFTDNHITFRQSKSILVPKYNHYAGVLVDIFYDHFLTCNWSTYSDESLPFFSSRCENTIEKYWDDIPEKMKMFFRYIRKYDRINGYNQINTIKSVLTGMSRRTSFASNMENATLDLLQNFEVLESHFKIFFPELQNFVRQEIAEY